MWDVEALGLLKMDFLGLRNLDVIEKTYQLVGGLSNEKIPLDDKKTYEMLARGDAMGVFQFESSGMREALKQVRPTEFEDLIALVALYRPGPMGYIPTYAKRKNGLEQVTFIDERVRPITESTYGICIYQEQYMEIAKQLAGFSPAEADDLRKAIGKKIHSLMASLKEKFLEGCAQNGVSHQVATQLWKDTEQSQDYSFNKSHSAGYALIAYRTAWLKANPHQYMAALISSVMNTKDRVPLYVNACAEMGIEVEPPDVNVSQTDFAVVEGKIRFGLNAVKNVGEGAAAALSPRADRAGPSVAVGIDRARADDGREQARARVADHVRCAGLDRRVAERHARRARAALGSGARRQEDIFFGQESMFEVEHPPIAAAEERPPADGEGVARPLRLRASADGGEGAAGAQDRLPSGRGTDAA